MLSVGGRNSGDGFGHFRNRDHAPNAPAIPTGTIGQVARLMSSDTPAFSGCTVPSCVRSPSGKPDYRWGKTTATDRLGSASHDAG